jgi:hypothetical protein
MLRVPEASVITRVGIASLAMIVNIIDIDDDSEYYLMRKLLIVIVKLLTLLANLY